MTASIVDGERWLASEREALARVDLKAEAQSVGRVEQIADGVARVSGLPEARLGELLRFEGGRMGYALSLDRDAINAAIFDEAEAIGVGSLVVGDRRGRARAGRPGPARARRRSARAAARPRRADRGRGLPAGRAAGAGDHRPRAGRGAGRDRRAGGRRAVRARARPAGADHRRPRDRQDGDRGRRDHQPEALRHDLRLCRGRPARDRGRAGDRGGPGARARRSAACSSSLRPPRRRRCNGSRPSPASPSPNISATRAATRSSSSTI